jgi:hypothetical protein
MALLAFEASVATRLSLRKSLTSFIDTLTDEPLGGSLLLPRKLNAKVKTAVYL